MIFEYGQVQRKEEEQPPKTKKHQDYAVQLWYNLNQKRADQPYVLAKPYKSHKKYEHNQSDYKAVKDTNLVRHLPLFPVNQMPAQTLGTGVLGRTYLASIILDINEWLSGHLRLHVDTHETLHQCDTLASEQDIRQRTSFYVPLHTYN